MGAQEVTARALRESAKHFVNYNKVESFFMICSIIVCLSGVMFASGYFNMEYLQSQKQVLGISNMTIVVYSLSFFFYVIGMEVTAVKKFRQTKNKAKWQAFQKKAAFNKDIMKIDNSNATFEEKQAASKIGAAFKGREARKALKARIEREGTEEERSHFKHLEEIQSKKLEKRIKKKKKMKKSRTKQSTRKSSRVQN